MERYGGVDVQLHHSRHQHRIEVSGQIHASAALPQEKEPPVPIG
jgi:hypothetical protein